MVPAPPPCRNGLVSLQKATLSPLQHKKWWQVIFFFVDTHLLMAEKKDILGGSHLSKERSTVEGEDFSRALVGFT